MTRDLAVKVDTLTIELVAGNGRRQQAEIYLHTSSDRRLGPETLAERLSALDETFLPCSVAGEVELVNLEQLAYLECRADLSELVELEELGSFRASARLELAHGEVLSGELRYRLPPGSCRVSDLLNAPGERFLLLAGTDRAYFVNRNAVVRVWAGEA